MTYEVDAHTGCWVWTGGKTNGYGWMEPERQYAHRVFYERAYGAIPEGLHIDHLCRNRACVRPAHLEAVTPGENTRRRPYGKTACPKGHSYLDPKNVYRRKNGAPVCRACRREQMGARREAA